MKKKSAVLILKLALIAFTLIYPLFMVIMSGAGLVSNSESYGSKLTFTGILLILSGVMMTAGTVFLLLRKKIPSLLLSSAGFIICITAMLKLIRHADNAGWYSHISMQPAGDIYFARIFPVIIPFILTAAISIIDRKK